MREETKKQIFQVILVLVVVFALQFGVRFIIAAHDRGYLSPDHLMYDTSVVNLEIYSNHIIYTAN